MLTQTHNGRQSSGTYLLKFQIPQFFGVNHNQYSLKLLVLYTKSTQNVLKLHFHIRYIHVISLGSDTPEILHSGYQYQGTESTILIASAEIQDLNCSRLPGCSENINKKARRHLNQGCRW